MVLGSVYRVSKGVLPALCLLFWGAFPTAGVASSSLTAKAPKVSTSLKNATTAPLSSLRAPVPKPPAVSKELTPRFDIPKHLPSMGKEASVPVVDSAVQSTHPVGVSMPATLANFEGIPNLSGVLPPDTVGDVGPNHYVEMVNLQIQVWDKSGTSLLGPMSTNALWGGFGGICESNNDGDPIVLYDQAADRWLLSQFALSFPNNFHQCVAISATGDPTGAYHLYDFLISTTKMNDYPHFGVWPDGYYMSINQYDGATSAWAGQGAVAFERDQMLAGLPAQMIYFDDPAPSLGAMLPSDWDGMAPPPPSAPNLFTQLGTATSLDIWELHVDWVAPANSTFTSLVSPAVTAFDGDLCGGSRNCIAQPGGTPLDSIADRLMHRVQYRNFGTHESMVTNHTVDATGTDQAGVRWYELRNTGGAGWVVHQQGTYAPDSDNRWMASAAMDGQGNIAVGYSVSSTTTYPSIRYTGRLVGDPPNGLAQGEAELIAGSGYQTHTSGRWGDYSSMSVDPVDDCTFWYVQEYYEVTGQASWQTRVGSFKFPSCTSGPVGEVHGRVTQVSGGSAIEGALVELGAMTTTADANGDYTFAYAPVGTYDMTVSAWGYVTATQSSIVVDDGSNTQQDFILAAAPLVTIIGTVSDGSSKGWPLYARIDIAGAPLEPLYTDPTTGAYSVSLPAGAEVTLNVSVDGYISEARGITVPLGSMTQHFVLLIDGGACSAPGYRSDGLDESFDSFPPVGWSVVDIEGAGVVWSSVAGSGETGNYTGGTGDAASVSSDVAGTVEFDTALLSPVMPVPDGVGALSYMANYQNFAGSDFLDVDIAVDGDPWVTLLSWNEDHGTFRSVPGEAVSIDLSGPLAGATSYQLRWHYYDPNLGDFDWYAQIDDVRVGTCVPDPTVGGLISGYVFDDNTLAELVGATVEDSSGTFQTMSVATPDDPNLGDGFYQLALPAGVVELIGSAVNYGTDTHSITMPSAGTQDFMLPAGLLAVDPTALSMTLGVDTSDSSVMTLDNMGGGAANFELMEFNVPYLAPVAAGPWAENTRHASPKHLDDRSAAGLRYHFPAVALPNPAAAGDLLNSFDPALAHPWGMVFNNAADDLWLSSPAAGGGDDQTYQYAVDGTSTGNAIDNAGWMDTFVADGAYDPGSNTLWQVNVGGDSCIYESDPVTLLATGSSICPSFGTSERGLAYDPVSDTFYAGSWNDGIINHFNRSGAILDSMNVGLGISGLAFNPDSGLLYVISNTDQDEDIVALDVNDAYTPIASFQSGLDDFAQAGLGIDCDGHLWAVVQPGYTTYPAGQVVELDSGELSACAYMGIDWLSESPTIGTVAAAGQEPVDVTFDATGLAVGTYAAHLRVNNDTPYGTEFVPVTLEVVPNETDLVVTKTDNQATVAAGAATNYIITVTNNGPLPVTGAVVSDIFVADLLNPSWSCVAVGGAICDTATKTGNINETVDLPVSGMVIYSVTADVDANASGTLSNTALVTSPITDSNSGDESALDETAIEQKADLVVTKTDNRSTILAGTSTSYIIKVTNNGPTNVVGATVSDTFPAELLKAAWNCTPTGGAICDTASKTGNINEKVDLPVNGSVTYNVTAYVDINATGTLSNTASVTSPITDAAPGNESATDKTTVEVPTPPSAGLAITKSDGVSSILGGTATAYTISVTNNGPDLVSGVTVNDVLAAELLNAVWSCVATNGATCDSAPQTGDIDQSVDLPVGGVVTYSLNARIQTGATGTLSNTVSVTSPIHNPDDTDASDVTALLCSGSDETLTGYQLIDGDVVDCSVSGTIGVGDMGVEEGAVLTLGGVGIGFTGTFAVQSGGTLTIVTP